MLIQKQYQGIFSNYSSALVTPKLIQLSSNLFVAQFDLMKLIPAKYTILSALNEDKIDPRYPIVETSSGTYALGMGIVCAELKLPFQIISDPVLDHSLKRRLEELGGKVQILTKSGQHSDIQTLRLNALEQYLQDNAGAFWPSQYDNPQNRSAYYDFADYLLENIGDDFILIGAVGSGGSTCGAIERLRQTNEAIKLIGVDTFGSILFGLPKGPRQLRGLGNSIMPKNLRHEYFDQVHWLSAEIAYQKTRKLHATRGLFCGPTSGAAFHIAEWYAEKNKAQKIVMIAPDSGHRYASTVYNDEWLTLNNIDITPEFHASKKIGDLQDAEGPWSWIEWERRKLEVVKTMSRPVTESV